MAQLLTRYEPALSSRIEAAAKRAAAGEPFSPVETPDVAPTPRHALEVSDDAAAGALAQLWRDGLLRGDAVVNSDVFGAVGSLGEAWLGADRTELRNLVMKSQAEGAKAVAAAQAAADAAAEALAAGLPPPGLAKRAATPASAALAKELKMLARSVLQGAESDVETSES